jgi:hypothetical protein
VNGGQCKYCQSVRHLATACPTKLKPDKSIEAEKRAVPDVNVQDLLERVASDTDSDDDDKNDNKRGNTAGGASSNKAKAKADADVKAKPTQKKPKRRVVNF